MKILSTDSQSMEGMDKCSQQHDLLSSFHSTCIYLFIYFGPMFSLGLNVQSPVPAILTKSYYILFFQCIYL